MVVSAPPGDGPLIFIVTGEPSGDLLGARLIKALKAETGGKVRVMGIGGEAMAEEGLDSLYDLGEFAVMGLTEVLPKALPILKRIKQVLAIIRAVKPDVLVTIDSWGLTMRINKALRQDNPHIPQVHYVAPMVWAWRHKRIHQLAQWTDRLMCLLPNEPELFAPAGLKADFVGHSVVESGADHGDAAAFRARHDIAPGARLMAVLPGSRHSEVSRLLPLYEEVMRAIAKDHPDLEVVVPTVANVAEDVKAAVKSWPLPVTVVRGTTERYDAFAACDAALAASGTVALELALAGVPHIVCYKVSALTAWLFRRVSDHKYANLINILNDAMIIPEYIQEDCTPEKVTEGVRRLLDDPAFRDEELAAVKDTLTTLRGPEGSPSARAAHIVLSMTDKKETS